jgi:transcription antitermination protein NusB
MPSRRQIREAVVQFLYCADIEGGADTSEIRSVFWDLLTEVDRKRLLVVSLRALEHITQSRADRLRDLAERSVIAQALLSTSNLITPLKDKLTLILKLESTWSRNYDVLSKMPISLEDEDSPTDQLESALKSFFVADRILSQSRHEFLRDLDDYPTLRNQLEVVAANVRKLQRLSDRIQKLEKPDQFPDQADLKHIRDFHAEIYQLRQDADHLAISVLKHKTEVDEKLASVIENYIPSRVDPVDRAILRLAICEIIARPDVPKKVVINEAIELAKKFGTTDSGRFVNGILDKIVKNQEL